MSLLRYPLNKPISNYFVPRIAHVFFLYLAPCMFTIYLFIWPYKSNEKGHTWSSHANEEKASHSSLAKTHRPTSKQAVPFCKSKCLIHWLQNVTTFFPDFDPATHLKPIIGPGSKFHDTSLFVEGKVFHVNLTGRLVDGWRLPLYQAVPP